MYFDEEYENNIMLENVSMLFSNEERDSIVQAFDEQEIGVLFFGKRGMQSSIFDTAMIYINSNLTDLIIAGLLAPAAYDLLKNTILFVGRKISAFVHRAKKDAPVISLKMKSGDAEIIAPIPTNLSNEQFQMYMEMLQKALSEANEPKLKKITKYECFVAECDENMGKVIVKTMLEYRHEQVQKQKNREA